MKNYTQFIQSHQSAFIDRLEVGSLNIISGKVVACDPINDFDRRTFEREIPKGLFSVFLYYDKKEQAIGLAELKISNKPAVRWEMATLSGQNLSTLENGEYFGYPVDNGLGCFMDAETADLYEKCQLVVQEELGEDFISYYDNVLLDALALNQDLYLNHYPASDSPLNVIMFSSGWGDGVFASYWGFDENNQVCSLITDFNLFESEM